MRVLFVCTGNTCRSPMAEALLRCRARERGWQVEVRSAGLAAIPGLPASEHAREVLKRRGADLGDHRSRPLDRADLEWAELVLTMTAQHKRMVVLQFPRTADKVFTLTEYVNRGDGARDIADPFGGDLEAYARCADEIDAAVSALVVRAVSGSDRSPEPEDPAGSDGPLGDRDTGEDPAVSKSVEDAGVETGKDRSGKTDSQRAGRHGGDGGSPAV